MCGVMAMRGSDFEAWYRWQLDHTKKPPSRDQASERYYGFYSCNCESCLYRKANGFNPIVTDRIDCHQKPGVPYTADYDE